jgi:HlyD family secretion protein
MKRRTILYITLGILAVAAIIAVVAWRTRQAQTLEEETRTAIVGRGTLFVAISASGSIEPRTSTDLTFEQSGRVVDVRVKVGDRVEAGDVLAQLDDRQLALKIPQAQAALEAARAKLAQLKAGPRPEEIAASEADLRAAQAQTNNAVANLNQLTSGSNSVQITAAEAQVAQAELQYKQAQLEYDRVRAIKAKEETIEQAAYDLYVAEKNLVAAQAALAEAQAGATDQDLQAAQANVAAAQAQQDAAQAQFDLLIAGATDEQIAEAEADVEKAQTALEQAELALEHATMLAPFDGVVAKVNVSAGELASVGVPAITLLDPSQFKVIISVDELDIGLLKLGQTAQVTVDALSDAPLTGTVKHIAPAATLESGVVYYKVIIEMAPTDAPVRADMSANVSIIIEERTNVLTIPLWAVRIDRRTGQTYVNQESGKDIERTDVTLGARYEGYTEVIDGLEEGERVIWVSDDPFAFGGEQ